MESWAVFALLCTTVGLSAASGSSQRVNSCPQSWSFYNGRCFYVERRRMNWTQAQDNCQSMGGSLASIENMVEQQLIQELIRNGANTLPVSWVGGTSGEEVSNWRWIDGRKISYSDWCPGEPNNPHQRCLQINYSHWNCWDNDFCEVEKVSVCDVPAMYTSSATFSRVRQLDVLLSVYICHFLFTYVVICFLWHVFELACV